MKLVGIYKIQSPSGRVYIGQNWDIKFRWRQHRYRTTTKYSKLTSSFRKYGKKNHLFEVLHNLPSDVDQSIINNYEQFYMDAYRGAGVDLLNLKEAGSRGKLAPHVVEHIRKRNIGKTPWNKGKKIGFTWNKGLKGAVKMSEETKIKMSVSQMGKRNALGTIRPQAAIESTRLKNMGKKRSEEVKAQISNRQKGNKSGCGNKGKVRSEETKKRISETLKRRNGSYMQTLGAAW